jgi:hypothetical protein
MSEGDFRVEGCAFCRLRRTRVPYVLIMLSRSKTRKPSWDITFERALYVSSPIRQAIEEIAGGDINLMRFVAYLVNSTVVDRDTGWLIVPHDIIIQCAGYSKVSRTKAKSGELIAEWCEVLETEWQDYEYLSGSSSNKHRLVSPAFLKAKGLDTLRWKQLESFMGEDPRSEWTRVDNDKVVWKGGGSLPALRGQTRPQESAIAYMRRVPSESYRYEASDLGATLKAINGITDVDKREAAIRSLNAITSYGRPWYGPSEETVAINERFFDRSGGLGAIKGELKRTLYPRLIELDLKRCHPSIFAFLCIKHLGKSSDLDMLLDYLWLSGIPVELLSAGYSELREQSLESQMYPRGLEALAESRLYDGRITAIPAFKQASVYVLYAMGSKGLTRELTKPELGFTEKDVQELLGCPVFKALRRLQKKLYLALEGLPWVADAHGRRLRRSDYDKTSSFLAAIFASYELSLLLEAQRVTPSANLITWEHDGVGVIANDEEERRIVVDRAINAVNAKAKALGIPTVLVEKKR